MPNVTREVAMAMLQEFVDASLARDRANEQYQRTLSAFAETDLKGLFLVGTQLVRVNDYDCGGPRVELIGVPLNLAEQAWVVEPASEDIEQDDDLIPY